MLQVRKSLNNLVFFYVFFPLVLLLAWINYLHYNKLTGEQDQALENVLKSVSTSLEVEISGTGESLRALSDRGISVPDRVKIIGYDDLPFAQQTIPPLSTVRQDLVAGAAHLIDLLYRRIGGERTASVVLEPSLVIRAST